MSLTDIDSFLILAPHLDNGDERGVLEVASLWQDKGQNSDVTALLFHPNPVDGGTMSNKIVSTLYRYARDKGYNVVRYNSRGVGKSSGVATASLAEFLDAKCVLNWAVEQGATRFWLGGFSFGGFMACCVADLIEGHDDLSLDKLCLIAPSIIKNDVSPLNIPFDKTIMVYGDNDELVNPAVLEKFALDNHIAYQVMDTGHFFHGKLSELKLAVEKLDNA